MFHRAFWVGWMTLHDNVKFLFLLEHSTWACPWSVRARAGAVNILGPMARWQRSPSLAPLGPSAVCIWAGPPLREAQWVVFQFLCISYSCRFAVISRGFEIGLSWLSWRKPLPTMKEWKYERSLFCCCPVCSIWSSVQSCANGNCIMPYLELRKSWQLT